MNDDDNERKGIARAIVTTNERKKKTDGGERNPKLKLYK